MNNHKDFDRVVHWFNLINDWPPEKQKLKLKVIEEELSEAGVLLLKQMLEEDSKQTDGDFAPVSIDEALQAPVELEAEQHIGPYQITSLIAQGGMGAVYQGQRVEGGFEQQVAIKVPHGFLSQSHQKRFELERQVLARLQHPNIASLIDGGLSEKGMPYLVMEFISGETIDDYFSQNNLSLKARIRLIIQLCDAISYAHSQLVLHRDLKPQNVLVDANGDVKVLDFGIAKLLDDNEDVQTATQIMTKSYASPEQIMGEQVSTQSDLFSLAVVAFELITGVHPFQKLKERVKAVSIEQNILNDQRLRITQKELVTHPSHSELSGLNLAQITKDLDIIFSKALSHEPNRRYESVAEFKKDLNRFINNRPIAARAHSFSYRLSKTIDRHKIASIAVVLMMVSIISAAFYSWGQYQQAKSSQAQAELHLQSAQIEAKNATVIRDFMIDLLNQAAPKMDQDAVLVKDLLEDGLVKLDNNTGLNVEQKFTLFNAISSSAIKLSMFKPLEQRFLTYENSCHTLLGEEHRLCIEISLNQSIMLVSKGEEKEGLKKLQNLERFIEQKNLTVPSLLGIAKKKQFKLLNDLGQYKLAEEKYFQGVKLSPVQGSDNEQVLSFKHFLAYSQLKKKSMAEAKVIIDEIDVLLESLPDVTSRQKARNQVLKSIYYYGQYQFAASMPYREEAIRLLSLQPEYNTEFLLNVMNNYAFELTRLGKHDSAVQAYKNALKMIETYAPDSRHWAQMNYLRLVLVYWMDNQIEQFYLAFEQIEPEVIQNSSEYEACLLESLHQIRLLISDQRIAPEKVFECFDNEISTLAPFIVAYLHAEYALQNGNRDEALDWANQAMNLTQKKSIMHLGFQNKAKQLLKKLNQNQP